MVAALALLSSLMWGGSDFLGGLASRRNRAVVVMAWTEGLGFVLVSVAVLATQHWLGPLGWLPWGLAAGGAGAIGLTCYYAALAAGTMGVVSPIGSMGVLIPLIVGFLAGESPHVWQLAGIAAAVVGIVLTSGPELTGGAPVRPVLLATVACVCFGFFFVAMDAGARSNTLMTLWAMRAGVTVVALGFAAVRRSLGHVSGRDIRLIWLVALGDVSANLFFGIAASRGYLSIASVLASVYPVVTVLLAWLVLSQRLRRIQVAGVVMVLVGVALTSAA